MHLPHKRASVARNAEKYKQDAMGTKQKSSLRIQCKKANDRYRKETTKQRKCTKAFKSAANTVATLEKLLARAKKTKALKGQAFEKQSESTAAAFAALKHSQQPGNFNVSIRLNVGTVKGFTPHVSKPLEREIQALLLGQQTNCKPDAPCKKAEKRENDLIYQARSFSCLPTCIVKYCILAFSKKYKVCLSPSMLTELLTSYCVMGEEGYGIKKVIPAFNKGMQIKGNKLIGINDRDEKFRVKFDLELLAITREKQRIKDFAQTNWSKREFFLLYERMPAGNLHAILVQGRGHEFEVVFDPLPNRSKTKSMDDVYSIVLVGMKNIHTQPVNVKDAAWTPHESPNPPDVTTGWTTVFNMI